ncbi:hypothetical protein [Methylobacterium radiotolerans]|uniref:hypothetical protein n=1 Tax=Methylobacterium radiotolerans TaxID=31998 RepID=UPI003394E427
MINQCEDRVPDVEDDAGPGVRRQDPDFRRQVVRVPPQFGEDLVARAAELALGLGDAAALAYERLQPAAREAAPRYRRQVVELAEHPPAGQGLQGTEAEGGAADPAPGQAQGGEPGLVGPRLPGRAIAGLRRSAEVIHLLFECLLGIEEPRVPARHHRGQVMGRGIRLDVCETGAHRSSYRPRGAGLRGSAVPISGRANISPPAIGTVYAKILHHQY